MRPRAFFLLALLLLPLAAFAADAPVDSIIPDVDENGQNLRTCAAGWRAVILVFGGLLDLALYATILIATVVILYAGFLFLFNSANPENLSKGKTILANAAVGLMVALGAWLIVNTVLTGLGVGDVRSVTSVFGTGGRLCITTRAVTMNQQGQLVLAPQLPPIPPAGPGSCDPDTVRQAAIDGGYTDVTDKEVNTFACLAYSESSCGARTTGAKTKSGNPTSAAGPWQNLLGADDKCHSLTIPACGNLQCSKAFSGGRVKSDPDSQALAAQCYAAISNLKCATAAAICLNRASGNDFSDWTGTGDGYTHSLQKKCVYDYGR